MIHLERLGPYALRPGSPFSGPLGAVAEDVAREEVMRILGQLAAAEQDMSAWARTLDYKIAQRAATCEDLRSYNAEAIRLFQAEAKFRTMLVAAGGTEVEPPTYPVLFGPQAYVGAAGDTVTLRVSEAPGCGEGAAYPTDYAAIRYWGPPVPEFLTPQGSPGGGNATHGPLGIPPVVVGIFWWAAAILALGAAAALVGVAFAKVVQMLRADPAYEKGLVELGQRATYQRARADFWLYCFDRVTSDYQAQGIPHDPVAVARECDARAATSFPELPPTERGVGIWESIGKAVLWAGLGAGVLVGSWTLYKTYA